MITDGKPSAITEGGRLYKNPFGLDPRIVNQTLEEADVLPPQEDRDHHLHAGPGSGCSSDSSRN